MPERFEVRRGSTSLELMHLARYDFASRLARGRLLEIGIGEGYALGLVGENATSIVGVDYNIQCVRSAASRDFGKPAGFAAADACSLPFRGNSFDTVIAFELIEHLYRPAAMLREVRRVMAPSGRLILSTPNKSVFRVTETLRYHVSNFDHSSFADLLGEHFQSVRLYGENFADARRARAYAFTVGRFGCLVERCKNVLHMDHVALSRLPGLAWVLQSIQTRSFGASSEDEALSLDDITFDPDGVATAPFLVAVCSEPRGVTGC